MSEPTGAARRRGPFRVGDQVQLTDPKGRHHTFTLEAGKQFHTHKGAFPHDELIGAPEGSVVRTTGNVAYLALRPLLPGGILCAYVATTTQLARTVEAIREHGTFNEPAAWETMVRTWHVEGLAVRPDHRMIGHTGFLLTARRLADGVEPPLRRRRPA